MWGHSCRIVDPIRHMAKRDAKAEGEAPAATEKDPILSALKIDQVAIKDNEFFTRVDFNVPQDKQDPNTIMNTACIDTALPKPTVSPCKWC